MTDTAALLDSINKTLKAELPGVTQVVRRRIAAGIHGKLSEAIKTRDGEITALNRKVLDHTRELADQQRRHRAAVHNAAKMALATVEKLYGEASE
mgnify:CR=1 FL=1